MSWDWNWGRNPRGSGIDELEAEMKQRFCNRCGDGSFEPSTMHDVIGTDGRRWRLCKDCFQKENGNDSGSSGS